MSDLQSVASEVATVDEAVMKVLPFISTFIGFVPGGAVAVPFLPLAGELLQALDNAAKEIAAGNPTGAAQDVLQELIDHLTKGKPNSTALAPAPAA
jgi:hypothetical protein